MPKVSTLMRLRHDVPAAALDAHAEGFDVPAACSTENREGEFLEEVNGVVVPAVVLLVREETVEQEIIARLVLGKRAHAQKVSR